MQKNNFKISKEKIISFLKEQQHKEGYFISEALNDKSDKRVTVFYSALIGTMLLSYKKNIQIKNILDKIANFLFTEYKKTGMTYWSKFDKNFFTLPYPADLDDSALSAAVLCDLYPSLKPQYISDLAIILTHQEKNSGGPYYTWINGHQKPWDDIDPVVNSAINFILIKNDIKLNNLESFLIDSLKEGKWKSPYYASNFLNLYLIWRSISEESRKNYLSLIKSIIDKEKIENTFDIACKILITNEFNFDYEIIDEKTFFEITPIIVENINSKHTNYSGCKALNAVMWLMICENLNPNTDEDVILDYEQIDLKKQVINIVKNKIINLESDFIDMANNLFSAIQKTPVFDEIILISHDIGKSIFKELPIGTYQKLGAANLFGWMAFSLYDECYDEKNISPNLSLANIFIRESTIHNLDVANNLSVDPFLVIDVMDTIDQAHGIELMLNTDFNNKKFDNVFLKNIKKIKIENRSLGHGLGSLIISKKTKNDDFFEDVRKLLENYLSARQMCDDLHDWIEDYNAQRITSVTKNIFSTVLLNSENSIEIQKKFWNKGIDRVILETHKKIETAQILLKKIKWPNKKPQLIELSLKKLDDSLRQVEFERIAMIDLIKHFKIYG